MLTGTPPVPVTGDERATSCTSEVEASGAAIKASQHVLPAGDSVADLEAQALTPPDAVAE
jgi:hypothetical protein